MFLLLQLYADCDKKINIGFICLNIILLFILFIKIQSNSTLLFYGIILFFIWCGFLGKLYEFSKGQIPYFKNNNLHSSFFNNLIADINFNLVSKINLLVIPLFLLIILIFSHQNNFFSHILIFSTILLPLLILIYFFNKKYSFIKNESIDMIYNSLSKYNLDFIIYFSGNKESTFQVNSWLPVFENIDSKFILIIRERHHFNKLENINMPILYLNNTINLEKISKLSSIKGALYTTNVGKNIHLIRDTKIKHIFIGHGDSDKSSSSNNLFKLYDYIFVAGQAHIDRFKKNSLNISNKSLFKVGRPQLQVLKFDNNNENNKCNVLYAPTWEGYYKDSCYSSLGLLTNEISNISRNKSIDFNFKPHPLTGTINSKYKNHSYKIKLLSSNNHNLLYKYLFDADILIADISAILSDFLYFNKPIILYKPKFINDIKKESPISECAYIIDDKSDIVNLIEKIKTDDYLLEKRNAMKEYIMGGDKSSISRFSKALDEIKYSIN